MKLNFRNWMEAQQFMIYCDLDGVLCDLETATHQTTGTFMRAGSGILRAIVRHRQQNQGFDVTTFWENLPWTNDGKQLWGFISRYDPMILTGAGNDPEAGEGKKRWCERELGLTRDRIIVTTASKKSQYANPTSILIDDASQNITMWKAKGGIGIFHLAATSSIAELQQVLTQTNQPVTMSGATEIL